MAENTRSDLWSSALGASNVPISCYFLFPYVVTVVGRGAPRKMWRSCVKRDMKAMGIKEAVVLGGILLGVRPVPDIPYACLGSRTLKAYYYDDDDDSF